MRAMLILIVLCGLAVADDEPQIRGSEAPDWKRANTAPWVTK